MPASAAPAKPPRNAVEAATRLAAAGRKIVIGLPPHEKFEIVMGDEIPNFMGEKLQGRVLLVTGKATFKDWQEQAAFLGCKNPFSDQPGSRYYSTTLVSYNGKAVFA